MKLCYKEFFPKERDDVYFKNYVRFIESKLKRKLEKGTPIERHHIVPGCLFPDSYSMKEKNYKNRIPLTLYEHYIAHFLLYKSFPSSDELFSAFWLMSNRTKYKSTVIGAREYEKLRLRAIELNRERTIKMNEENWSDLAFEERMLNIFRGEWAKDDRRRKMISEKTKELWKDPEYREKVMGSFVGRRAMHKDGRTAFVHPENFYKFLKKGYKHGVGYTWSEEARESLSDLRKRQRWVTNGKKNKAVLEDDLQEWFDKGYRLGMTTRGIKDKEAYAEKRRNMTLINNGIKDRNVPNEELESYLKKGYVRGSLRKGKKTPKKEYSTIRGIR